MKTMVDMQQIEDILTRGVAEVIEKDSLRKKLLSGRKLTVKLGIDPTSPDIHLGRLVPLLKLRDFQKLGHKAVLVVGDVTGVIGDTSDKESERPMLSKKQVDINLRSYKRQAMRVLDKKNISIVKNSTWLNKLGYSEIGEHANLFSVADFIGRENIKKRLDAGKRVSLRETLYPLMQGYDSVYIKADIELGGSDQRFNLIAGRRLQEHYKQSPQDILMTNLIPGTDGRKMSSSWGNIVSLTDGPTDMFGKLMRIHDEDVVSYATHLTRMPMEEVEGMEKRMSGGQANRDAKLTVAEHVVETVYDRTSALKAKEEFVNTFSEKGIPESIPEIVVRKGEAISDILSREGVVSSKTECKRLIEAGALRNYESGEKIVDVEYKIVNSFILKVGKKVFVKIKIQ